MSDKSDKRAVVDRTRINVEENWELQYWSTKFRVTPGDLSAAVGAVGPVVGDVEKHLGIAGKSGRQ